MCECVTILIYFSISINRLLFKKSLCLWNLKKLKFNQWHQHHQWYIVQWSVVLIVMCRKNYDHFGNTKLDQKPFFSGHQQSNGLAFVYWILNENFENHFPRFFFVLGSCYSWSFRFGTSSWKSFNRPNNIVSSNRSYLVTLFIGNNTEKLVIIFCKFFRCINTSHTNGSYYCLS